MSRGLYNFPHGCIKRPEKQFKEEGSSLEINSVMEGQHGHGGWSSLCGSRSCTYFVTSQRQEVERTWLASALTCKICWGPSSRQAPTPKGPTVFQRVLPAGDQVLKHPLVGDISHPNHNRCGVSWEHVLLFWICSWPMLLIIRACYGSSDTYV